MKYTKKPWGYMITLLSGSTFWLKYISAKGRLSLQSHALRDEYHIGIYKVAKGEKHRLLPGRYLELAVGDVSESDVIRYEDDYGREKPVHVVVSGGFDPVHIGHIKLFEEARKLGTKLTVILNGDSWLLRKKGRFLMTQNDRAEILKALRCVDDVYIYESDKNDVSGAIAVLRPDIFVNGGDRKDEKDIPETEICKALGVAMHYIDVGDYKTRHSSVFLNNYENIRPN